MVSRGGFRVGSRVFFCFCWVFRLLVSGEEKCSVILVFFLLGKLRLRVGVRGEVGLGFSLILWSWNYFGYV